jgi:Zn-dependent protease/CBS domain-containing protein
MRSFRIFRIRGIEVDADASWVLIALVVVWSFWDEFTRRVGRHSVGVGVVMAVVAAALFFASILAHELAHAFEARYRGMKVGRILLYVFGGATETMGEPERARDEFVFVALGPYTSLVLAGAFALVSFGATQVDLGEVAEIAGLLGWVNLLLGAFNLLPGAPLDGGRMLAAVVWQITGDRRRGAIVAARSGQLLGTVALAGGLWFMFFVSGGLLSGVWLALIGWYLVRAAAQEQGRVELQALLSARTAAGLLPPEPVRLPATTTVAWAVQWVFHHHRVDDAAITGEDGAVVGAVTFADVLTVDPAARPGVTLGDVMRRRDELPVIGADEPADHILGRFAEAPVALVERDGEIVGTVSVADVVKVAERARQLDAVSRRRGARR